MDTKRRAALDRAVRRFMQHLFGYRWPQEETDEYQVIERLAWEAFKMYAAEWDDGRIEGWAWPLSELEEAHPFAGNLNPWTVLLREAVHQARRYMLNLPLEARREDPN